MKTSYGFVCASCVLAPTVLAASFPPPLEGITVVNSTHFPGVSISYKQTQICETTSGVKAYSGYVNLPPAPEENRDYEAHTFFWFIEARNDAQNAPLAIWLQGGPGTPSTPAAVSEHGPCIVNPDSLTTTLNPWSWNDKVNMLYIDQPIQTGFSYDTLINGTINEVLSPFIPQTILNSSSTIPATNATLLTGTFSSNNTKVAPRTAMDSARNLWHFLQGWTQEFPEYKPTNNKFSVWGESYGGHYAPTLAEYFTAQNKLIAAGTIPAPAVQFQLDTLGLVNACIDIDTQQPFYPTFAFNNTYGIQAVNETVYKFMLNSTSTCKNMTAACRALGDAKDPQGWGNVTDVNKACSGAYQYCFSTMHDAYYLSGRNPFDIGMPLIGSFPPKWAGGYLNTKEVQQALGVPLNFTGNSQIVADAFLATGDFVRGHGLAVLGQLLDQGVKVALVYGDRDFQCNWLGGEAISLAIQSQVSDNFHAAGYANIETNVSYVGGAVRQYGNLSFSRVFEAGHQVPYYQPETAYQIFNRVMFNMDVATGKTPLVQKKADYSSSGPSEVFSVKSTAPNPPPAQCYLWDMMETCSTAQKAVAGTDAAIIKDYILLGYHAPNGTDVYYPGANGSSAAGNTTGKPPPGNAAAGGGGSMRGALLLAGGLAVVQAILL